MAGGLLQLVVLSVAAAPAAGTAAQHFARGVAFFRAFDDAHAQTEFDAVLSADPPGEMSARARVYLGLIAFNAIRPDPAQQQFEAALLENPAVELPADASPKARMSFDEARQRVARRMAARQVQPGEAPEALVVPGWQGKPAPAEAVDAPPPSHSHALSITLGAIGLVAVGVGVYGAVEVSQYNSLVNQAPLGNVQSNQLTSLSAGFWAVAWIPFAVLGVAGITAAGFTW
jgi:hypothetical protein